MTERPEIELDRSDFRQVHKGPLANPRDLWFSVAVWMTGAVLAAFAGWQLGGFWAALLPIPPAIWAGAAIAGLVPDWFFGKAD